MEPILQHPFFATLLRVWKFFTTYHQYLELQPAYGKVSLYEFDDHVKIQNRLTPFIKSLIQALVKKSSGHKKSQQTPYFWAKVSKANIFDKLVNTSAYELGLSEVNFITAWRKVSTIAKKKNFENLSLENKYHYLSILTDLVSNSEAFRNTYLESVKKQYQIESQIKDNKILDVQKKFVPLMINSIVLGKGFKDKCYFFVSNIGDSILECDLSTKKWARIQGQNEIKQQILLPLLKQRISATKQQVDLIEQILDIWNRLKWSVKYSAFDRNSVLFDINQAAPSIKKVQLLKQHLHELDLEYTKFITECFNYRWASKQRRIEFHNEIDSAKTLDDLVQIFIGFYNATKNSSQKKIKNFQYYDHSLDTKDVPSSEFKQVYLFINYLYMKGAFAQSVTNNKYCVNLLRPLKGFISNLDKFSDYSFEYMTIFLHSMLAIISQLYPKKYEQRLLKIKQAQNAQNAQRKKKQQEQALLKKNLRSKAHLSKTSENHDKNRIQQYSETQSDTQSDTESETNVEFNNCINQRLRKKTRIVYRDLENSSTNKSNTNNSHSAYARQKKLSLKNNNKAKKSKMMIDSDDDEDSSLSIQKNFNRNNRKSHSKAIQIMQPFNLDNFLFQDQSLIMKKARIAQKRNLRMR